MPWGRDNKLPPDPLPSRRLFCEGLWSRYQTRYSELVAFHFEITTPEFLTCALNTQVPKMS